MVQTPLEAFKNDEVLRDSGRKAHKLRLININFWRIKRNLRESLIRFV